MRIIGIIAAALLASVSVAHAVCPTTASDCPPIATIQLNLGGAILNPQGVPLIPPNAKGVAGYALTLTNPDTGATTWTIGGTGSVTSASVATANGLSGSVANATTTPQITLSTTVSGMVKGNGTGFSAAIAGTDYLAPNSNGSGLSGLVWGQIGSTPTTLGGYGITDAVPKALPSAQINVGSAGNLAAPVPVSGDATLANTGALTVTGTGGVAFAPSATTDTTNAANITSGTLPAARLPVAAITGGTISGATLNSTFSVIGYGAKCDDTTDDTAAINAAIAAASAVGGGTVYFPAMCLMTGAMVIPYTGTTNPVQNPIRLTGLNLSPDTYLGFSSHGVSTPIGGGGLDMRYGGGDGTHVAKIDTRGSGLLEIDHLNIVDGGTDNYQFIQTTNTALNIHDNRFSGNTTCLLTTCTQDAILLGGNTSAANVLGTNAATDGFQGYGTKIENNWFSFMRVVVGFGGAANGVYLANNTVDHTCGSAATQGAPYTWYGLGATSGGDIMSGGIIELAGYPYAVAMLGTQTISHNYIVGLGVYDEVMGSPTIGFAYASATSIYNTISPSWLDSLVVAISGPGAATNTVLAGNGKGNQIVGGIQSTGTQPSWVTNDLGVGNTSPQFPLDVGAGTGKIIVRINGGNTNSGDGGGFELTRNNTVVNDGGCFYHSTYPVPIAPSQSITCGGFNGFYLSTNNADQVFLSKAGNLSFLSAAPVVSACGTSPSIDAHASSMAGTVTAGASATSCAITFATAFGTWNHCRVTAQSSLTALAYSYTLAAITVTATSLTGKIDYACDGQ